MFWEKSTFIFIRIRLFFPLQSLPYHLLSLPSTTASPTTLLSSEQKYDEDNCFPVAVLVVSAPNKLLICWYNIRSLIILEHHRCSIDECYRKTYQYIFYRSILKEKKSKVTTIIAFRHWHRLKILLFNRNQAVFQAVITEDSWLAAVQLITGLLKCFALSIVLNSLWNQGTFDILNMAISFH